MGLFSSILEYNPDAEAFLNEYREKWNRSGYSEGAEMVVFYKRSQEVNQNDLHISPDTEAAMIRAQDAANTERQTQVAKSANKDLAPVTQRKKGVTSNSNSEAQSPDKTQPPSPINSPTNSILATERTMSDSALVQSSKEKTTDKQRRNSTLTQDKNKNVQKKRKQPDEATTSARKAPITSETGERNSVKLSQDPVKKKYLTQGFINNPFKVPRSSQ